MTQLIPVLTVLIAFQVQVPQRDQPPPQQMPTVRLVPVGTSSIGGTVTAADTGRPIRGARVMLNGNTAPAGRGREGMPPVTTSLTQSAGRSQPPGAASLPPGGVGTTGRASQPGLGSDGQAQYVPYVSRSAITDELGSFLIEKLPPGQYQLSVSAPRNTYLPVNYGQKKVGGPPAAFPIADGQRAKINVQLIRGGVISGTVFSEDGDPQSNSQVRASRYAMSGGVKRIQSSGFAQTDDRGVYRIFGLQPGDYVVSATPDSNALMSYGYSNPDEGLVAEAIASGAIRPPAGPGLPATVAIPIRTPDQQRQMNEQRQMEGPPPGYLPVFHPGSPTRSGATLVHVNGGEERSSVDIALRLVQATNILGTIQNPPGEGLGVQLSLITDDPTSEMSGNSARVDNNGRFAFRNIPPGKYTILAQVILSPTMTIVNGVTIQPNPQQPRQLDDSQKWWGRAVVDVEGQPSLTADITLKPGRTISGRVVFETERMPDLTRQKVMVSLNQAPGVQYGMYSQPPQAELAPDGTFTLKGVIPGKYILRAQSGYQKSIMINGQDILDFPLDFTGDRNISDAVITVTDKFNEVSGILTDGSGKPAPDYTIVAASADERFWTPSSRRIVISKPSPEGKYTFRNLPAGEYLLAAVTELDNGEQFDPEFLKNLASTAAMRILVTEGGKITQDLRVGR